MTHLFSGVAVALVTLFHEHGELDATGTARLAARLVDEDDVRAVLVGGSTGEAAALSAAERIALVRAVREAVPSGIPILAGTTAPTGPQAAELVVQAFDVGADAALVLSPPRVSDPRRFYDTVAAAAAARPLLAYHYPAATLPGIAVDALADLPVDGLKDSSGDPERLLQEVTSFRGSLYVGSAPLVLMAGAVGATGAILALGNVVARTCAAALAGDGEAQRRLLDCHLPASRLFPAGLKDQVAARFGVSATCRLGG
jgi:4-hydroxy-tetrahydrodipicolinate synthase